MERISLINYPEYYGMIIATHLHVNLSNYLFKGISQLYITQTQVL